MGETHGTPASCGSGRELGRVDPLCHWSHRGLTVSVDEIADRRAQHSALKFVLAGNSAPVFSLLQWVFVDGKASRLLAPCSLSVPAISSTRPGDQKVLASSRLKG